MQDDEHNFISNTHVLQETSQHWTFRESNESS